MRSLAQELAIEARLARKAAAATPDAGLPVRSYTAYPTPRPVSDWVEAGQVLEGHEVNGLALPSRVVDSLGRGDPPEYVVVGEERYDDGRWYLDVAVSDKWVTANLICRDCGVVGGGHDRVEYTDDDGKVKKVACPSAPRPARRR